MSRLMTATKLSFSITFSLPRWSKVYKWDQDKVANTEKQKQKSSVISEDYAASLAKPYMGECDTSSPTRDDHCDSPPSLSPELAV